MDQYIQKIQNDIQEKMLSCIKGENFIKPLSKIYNEVRKKQNQTLSVKEEERSMIYSNGEATIYAEVIKEFLIDFKKTNNHDEEKET